MFHGSVTAIARPASCNAGSVRSCSRSCARTSRRSALRPIPDDPRRRARFAAGRHRRRRGRSRDATRRRFTRRRTRMRSHRRSERRKRACDATSHAAAEKVAKAHNASASASTSSVVRRAAIAQPVRSTTLGATDTGRAYHDSVSGTSQRRRHRAEPQHTTRVPPRREHVFDAGRERRCAGGAQHRVRHPRDDHSSVSLRRRCKSFLIRRSSSAEMFRRR